MPPIALPDERTFALKVFMEQASKIDGDKDNIELFFYCLFLLSCFSFFVYVLRRDTSITQRLNEARQSGNVEIKESAMENADSEACGMETQRSQDSTQLNRACQGPSPPVSVNRPKADHPLYGSLTAQELPKPREASILPDMKRLMEVSHDSHETLTSWVLDMTDSSKARDRRPLQADADHCVEVATTAHREEAQSFSHGLMALYGTFEGSFRKDVPAMSRQVVRKSTLAEDNRSDSSWATIGTEDFDGTYQGK